MGRPKRDFEQEDTQAVATFDDWQQFDLYFLQHLDRNYFVLDAWDEWQEHSVDPTEPQPVTVSYVDVPDLSVTREMTAAEKQALAEVYKVEQEKDTE